MELTTAVRLALIKGRALVLAEDDASDALSVAETRHEVARGVVITRRMSTSALADDAPLIGGRGW